MTLKTDEKQIKCGEGAEEIQKKYRRNTERMRTKQGDYGYTGRNADEIQKKYRRNTERIRTKQDDYGNMQAFSR